MKLIIHLAREAYNSPTITTWLRLGAVPLRVAILTPLVLTQFDEIEIGCFYLLASTGLFVTLVYERLREVFTQMLAYAYSGADDLSPIQVGEGTRGNGEVNKNTFRNAAEVLKKLQLRFGFPCAVMGVLIMGFGIGQLINWKWNELEIWLLLPISMISHVLNLLMSHNLASLIGAGYVAKSNRFSIWFSLLSVAAAALAVVVTQSLLWMMIAQFGVTFFERIGIARMAKKSLSWLYAGSKKVSKDEFYRIRHCAWKPLWRSTIGVLAGRGLASFAAVYATGLSSSWGTATVVSFLCSQSLLTSLERFCSAPIISNRPFLCKLLSNGNILELRKIVIPRLLFGSVAMIIGIVLLGLLGPMLLEAMGSNARLIAGYNWWIYGILLWILITLRMCGNVFNITNQAKFAYRNLIAAIVTVLILFLWDGIEMSQFLVALILPRIVFLEGSTIRNMTRLLSIDRDNLSAEPSSVSS